MNSLRVSKFLFTALSAYIVLCVPAIFVAEHYGLPEAPLHGSQFLAVVACIPSAATFLWLSRGSPLRGLRLVAALAITLAALWVAFLVYFVMTADFGTD